eukprot:5426-Heterococcus_DN1.PRE.2
MMSSSVIMPVGIALPVRAFDTQNLWLATHHEQACGSLNSDTAARTTAMLQQLWLFATSVHRISRGRWCHKVRNCSCEQQSKVQYYIGLCISALYHALLQRPLQSTVECRAYYKDAAARAYSMHHEIEKSILE